jgi:hypothetical protein
LGRFALAGPSIAKVKRIPYTSGGEQVTVVVEFGSRMKSNAVRLAFAVITPLSSEGQRFDQ